MRQKLAIYTGLLAIVLAGCGSAMAQVLPFYPAPAVLAPQEVVKNVRSAGLEPLTRPVRHGPVYVLQAANPSGREVRVVVDARIGRIMRIVPTPPAAVAAAPDTPPLPAPYSRPPGDIAAVPDGYGPTARVTGPQPNFDGPAPYGPALGDPPASVSPPRTGTTGSIQSTPRANTPPPLPRARPKVAAAEPETAPAPAAAVSSPAVAPAATGTTTRGGAAAVPTAAPAATPPTVAAPPAATPEYEQHE